MSIYTQQRIKNIFNYFSSTEDLYNLLRDNNCIYIGWSQNLDVTCRLFKSGIEVAISFVYKRFFNKPPTEEYKFVIREINRDGSLTFYTCEKIKYLVSDLGIKSYMKDSPNICIHSVLNNRETINIAVSNSSVIGSGIYELHRQDKKR